MVISNEYTGGVPTRKMEKEKFAGYTRLGSTDNGGPEGNQPKESGMLEKALNRAKSILTKIANMNRKS